MVLWFNQPELGLPSKEYFEDEEIREIYQDTLTQLIESVLDVLEDDKDDDDDGEDDDGDVKADLTVNDEPQTWPPWPWPPWGGDDDPDDGGKEPPSKQPRSIRARKLAKQVVTLERKTAKASLDL